MKRIMCVCLVALFSLAVIGTDAYAGDCKNVTFKFKNSTGAKIKVKKIDITGNDGSWTEDFNNLEIDSGGTKSTNPQDLNKLDTGKTGTFKVQYDRWYANDNEYKAKSQTFSKKCSNDGMTMTFELTNK